jgi:hypothetical protein
MAAFAALVAVTIFLVYAYRDRQPSPGVTAASEAVAAPAETPPPAAPAPESAEAKDQDPALEPLEPAGTAKPPAKAPAQAATPGGAAGEVLYDPNVLPDPIKNTLQGIVVAAQSGNIDEMLPVLQENELPPMLAPTAVSDPIAFWRKASADGEGRDILAAMLNVFSSGFVRTGDGRDAVYVWPYFAEMDLSKLTPEQEVELFRIVPAAQALEMKKSGKYTYYRAGIGGDGVWHYFLQ